MANFDYLSSWFTNKLVTNVGTKFIRVKTDSQPSSDSEILDGLGFFLNWVEIDVGAGASRYAIFDVPVGYKMKVDRRMIDTATDSWWYHVYPQGTYTLETAQPNNLTGGFVKSRNLRQESAFIPTLSTRYTLAVGGEPTRLTDSLVDEPVWGATANGGAAGELDSEKSFLLLDGGQQFLLQLLNSGAGIGSAQVQVFLTLIPDSDVSPI